MFRHAQRLGCRQRDDSRAGRILRNCHFVTQTDARNAANGDHGQGLVDLDNRIFLTRIAGVSCSLGGCVDGASWQCVRLWVQVGAGSSAKS